MLKNIEIKNKVKRVDGFMNRVDRNFYCLGRWQCVDEQMKWADKAGRWKLFNWADSLRKAAIKFSI